MSAKRLIFQYVCASLLITVFSLTVYRATLYDSFVPASATVGYELRSVILDAGHGGKDGGAVSVTGSVEKDLNLDITLSVSDIMHLLGYNVILTRSTDTELTHSDGGSRKMQDLKGRLTVATKNKDTPFVSIHMNKFPTEKYRGLQIYYSPKISDSRSLAEKIQSTVRNQLDSDNNRSIKPSGSGIYLLHNAVSPAVLIECGFLSNNEEAMLLDTPEYRTKLCTVIASSVDMWYNSYENTKG